MRTYIGNPRAKHSGVAMQEVHTWQNSHELVLSFCAIPFFSLSLIIRFRVLVLVHFNPSKLPYIQNV